MIELVFLACSILHGAECKQIRQTYIATPGELPVWACAKNGQHHASQWAAEHPNWRVQRWTCRQAKQEAKA